VLSKRVGIVGLLQAAAVVTVVFSLLTSFPSVHHHVELFSHFRLQYLAVSLLLLIVFAGLRHPAYSALLVVAAVLNASYVVPWYFGDTPSKDAAALKLMHANILSRNEQHGRLLEFIAAEQPDLVFLQEVSPEWLGSIEALGEDYPFSYTQPRHDNFGIALFSRLPLDSVSHVDSAPLDYPTIVATLNVDGTLLTLINTHPTIPLTKEGFEARNEQLQSVAEIANAAAGAVILSGDFNTSMWSPAYRTLLETTGLRDARRGAGILPTWPTFIPFAMIPIDHALVSDDIDVVNIEVGARVGSDHLPLILEFSIGR
jgi:endonuclease/exonuclease/phosphatase (EEP) superfamily protein YafD